MTAARALAKDFAIAVESLARPGQGWALAMCFEAMCFETIVKAMAPLAPNKTTPCPKDRKEQMG